ncbi:MAG: DUF3667 domain-containing protein [Polymorphobacter sp.]
MPDQIDALGNLATATLAAHALDRNALHEPGLPGHCANCAAPVAGRFCANCGQPAHVHRSLLHVGEEFLHGLTHFDGKAWKTLPLLLFRPGKLTRDYVEGKRARYVPPVALFLLSVFLMFFAFSFVEGPPQMQLDTPVLAGGTPAERAAALQKADAAVAELTAELARAQADPHAAPGQAGVLAGALAAAEAVQRSAQQAQARSAAGAGAGAKASIGASASTKPLVAVDDASTLSINGAAKLLRDADKNGELNLDTGSAAINERIRHALDNPELALYKIQSKAYKFSFLLVPLSLPVLWLLFVFRRQVYLYDHVVFALYSLSFMSLVVITASTMFALGYRGALYAPLLLLVPPLHMFAQLKGAYRLSVFGAAWRAAVLVLAAVFTLGFFALLIGLLGVVD